MQDDDKLIRKQFFDQLGEWANNIQKEHGKVVDLLYLGDRVYDPEAILQAELFNK